MHLTVNEVLCKSVLNKSGIEGVDYSFNPYIGCVHGCVYCYACFMARYRKEKDEWGSFVDVKINALDVLATDVLKKKRESFFYQVLLIHIRKLRVNSNLLGKRY